MGVPLTRAQRLQASLPKQKGVCGIKLLRTYAPAAGLAFLAAYECRASSLGVPAPWAAPLPGDISSPCEAVAAMGVSRTSVPLANWLVRPASASSALQLHQRQRWWAEQSVDAQAEELRNLLAPTARDSARVALQAKGDGTGWMQVPPHPGLGTVMPHSEYQLGLRWWLGLPLQDSEGAPLYAQSAMLCRWTPLVTT